MITVLQILLGKVPYYLVPCLNSVSQWAHFRAYEYVILTDKDNPFQEFNDFNWLRQCSDVMRLKYLSKHPRTLYVDWDMFIKDIIIDDLSKPAFAHADIAAGLIYNGDDLDLFEQLRSGILPKNNATSFPIMHRLRDYINNDFYKKQKFSGTYAHLDNCVIVRQSYGET